MGSKTVILISLTAVSFFIAYATGILLARSLGIGHYDDYAVAVAAVTMLSTLVEFGTGKFAMRTLPVYEAKREWGRSRGYRRFATIGVLLASAAVGVGIFVVHIGSGSGSVPLGLAALFLPAMALVGYGAEVVQANRATVPSALITRIVVPGVTLVAVAAWMSFVGEASATTGVVLYGSGWVVGLVTVALVLTRTTPAEVRSAEAETTPGPWIAKALPFMVIALLAVAMARVVLVVMEGVASPDEVSTFAVALETGLFLYLVAKSTDKMFLPELSVLLERRDVEELLRGRSRRLRWIGPLCLAFLALMVLFGRRILSMFGPGFSEGYAALVIVSAGTAVWTTFSLAPSYLNYVGKARLVVGATGVAVGAMVVLTWWLGGSHGDTGAAIAFALPVAVLYGLLAILARQDIGRLARSSPEKGAAG